MQNIIKTINRLSEVATEEKAPAKKTRKTAVKKTAKKAEKETAEK